MSRLRHTLVKQAIFEKIKSSLQTMETQISSATVFVKEIERGNRDAQYTQEEVDGSEGIAELENQVRRRVA